MGGSAGGAGLCCWYTVTDVALGEKDEADDEAVAAFTTPLVMISLILLTAPEKDEGKELLMHLDKAQLSEGKSAVLTVNKLPGLSLDMQIQRSVPGRKKERSVQSFIFCQLFNHLCFMFLEIKEGRNLPWESFCLLLCCHVTASG